jgi:glutamine synthetase
LNYIDENGGIQNLFKIPKNEEDLPLFKLFILIQLKALINYSKLYLASVSVSGNELRLGGHEAPPRIISAFLGSTISALLDNKKVDEPMNLRDNLPNIDFDIEQEDTDRNRTSPYAYTGNKF